MSFLFSFLFILILIPVKYHLKNILKTSAVATLDLGKHMIYLSENLVYVFIIKQEEIFENKYYYS